MENLFTLPEEYELLRTSVRALAVKKIEPFAQSVDSESRFPHEAHDALQQARLLSAHIPTKYGGEGADSLATVITIEEVARVCASTSLLPAVNKLGSLPIILVGTEEQKNRWLTPLAGGKCFSYCLSESEAGSDAGALKTKATRSGDKWILHGSKKWISNAGHSDFYTVFASTDLNKGAKGITAFLVAKTDAGLSFGAVEKKMGFRGSPTCEVFLDNIELDDDRRLGDIGEGFSIAMRTLDQTRITIAAQALGIAQGALDCALKYAKERKQFGKPIKSFQAIQFMLADMAMDIAAARHLTYAAATRAERGDRDLTFYSAASKCFASDMAMRVTTDAVQILGGYGYVADFPVERMMRDAKLTQIYEGTNQIQRIVMARHLDESNH